MIYENLIDNYLLGKMSKEEEQEFLSECKVNKTLKEEAIAMAYLIKGLNTLQEQLFQLLLIFLLL